MNLQDYKKQQLAEKIRQMKTMNLSPEEIQKSFTGEELNMIDKAVKGNDIEKGKSFPIGTVHNGFKKVGEGKWRKVSEHGMTRSEHRESSLSSKKLEDKIKKEHDYPDKVKDLEDKVKTNKYHSDLADKLDDKEYSDEDVHDKKEAESGSGESDKKEKEFYDKIKESTKNNPHLVRSWYGSEDSYKYFIAEPGKRQVQIGSFNMKDQEGKSK